MSGVPLARSSVDYGRTLSTMSVGYRFVGNRSD